MSRRWRHEQGAAVLSGPGVSKKICVLIFTHNRPDELRRLLGDIRAFKGRHDVRVRVWEDGSGSGSATEENVDTVMSMGGCWTDGGSHGKKKFWLLVRSAYETLLEESDADYFVSVPDDARLCRDFFDRAIRAWESIDDPDKVCLNIWRDPRDHCWTGETPSSVNDLVRKTGWVDGAFIAERGYFTVNIRPIPENFWDLNPLRGSGVGQRITTAWAEQGRTIYQVEQSLMAHAGCVESKMNPEERKKNPLRAKNFADGQRVCDALEYQEPVTASLATIPRRVELLKRTVESLLPQVDRLCVYLNGHEEVPEFLAHPRIVTAHSKEHGDRGDAGKFFWSPEEGYHLTCDDDLVYPPDYVRSMVEAIEKYERKRLVSFHGAQLRENLFNTRRILQCKRRLSFDAPAHLPGTGVMGHHADTISFSRQDFKVPNMADVWAGIKAKEVGVPVVVVAHKGGWIGTMRDVNGPTIFETFVNDSRLQNEAIKSASPWPKFHGNHGGPKKKKAAPPQQPLRPIFVGGAGRCGATTVATCIASDPKIARFPREARFIVDHGGLLDLADALTNTWDPFRASQAIVAWRELAKWLSAEQPKKEARAVWAQWPEFLSAACDLADGFCRGTSPGKGNHLVYDVPQVSDDEIVDTFQSFLSRVYRSLAPGATGFVEDTSYSVLAVERLRERFPGCRVVWVVRDPFEVAIAHTDASWGEKTLEANAKKIRGVFRRARELQTLFSATVKLENLVQKPDDALSTLREALGAKIHSAGVAFDLAPRFPGLPAEDKELLHSELGSLRKELGY